MKVAIVNGTDKHGVTRKMKDAFMDGFGEGAEVTEFSVPSDGPGFCSGCMRCLYEGEHACRDAVSVAPIGKAIDEADLVILTSPVYVYHATGAMKNLLDHFAYRWMPHRPSPAMFTKRAVIITQCAGMGTRTTAGDLRDSLAWWGVSDIKVVAARTAMSQSDEKAMEKILRVCRKAGRKTRSRMAAAPAVSIGTRGRFAICRMLQKKLIREYPESLDAAHWEAQGWLGNAAPWKRGG